MTDETQPMDHYEAGVDQVNRRRASLKEAVDTLAEKEISLIGASKSHDKAGAGLAVAGENAGKAFHQFKDAQKAFLQVIVNQEA